MSPCTTIQLHDNGATLDCEEPVYGKYVKIVNRDGPVVICDFQIYGNLMKCIVVENIRIYIMHEGRYFGSNNDIQKKDGGTYCAISGYKLPSLNAVYV